MRWYVRNSVEPLTEGVKATETIESNDRRNKKEFKQRWIREKKELWKNKRMYGQFVREIQETTDEKERWYWLRKADLKVETKAMLCAAQEQTIRTNYVKHKIDKTAQSPFCRMYDKKSETISHIVSECEKVAQKEYKRRHDNVARIVHWKLCGKYNLKRSEKWYEHAPEGVVENEDVKILCDVMIQCDREIKARKPDIVVVNKNERSCAIIDIAIPGDIRVSEKEKENIQRYQELKRKIKRILNIRSIKVIPVVVGKLGSTSKKLKKCLEELGVVVSTALLKKTALLGTSRILRKVLDCG